MVCPGIIGGKLDFPRSASFASIKLVQWWEDEYVAAYKKASGFFHKSKGDMKSSDESTDSEEGIVKDSDPSKFISLVSKSAEQFLEHLHVLTQEALDHADLSVLTGTIGAAALLKNYLWFYVQTVNDNSRYSICEIQKEYRRYNEMCEALAERLLDLYCRVISLYVLQDAECLDWESHKPFFESERGSYTIQMWWTFMQGTKEDLWNTVPPKMAQRVFSGMLNESLTILMVRYMQSSPSESRSKLVMVDITNLLLCVAQLLPSICDSAKDFVGLAYHTSSKILRDVHTKCQELYYFLLLRGSSLDDLNKVFKKGVDDMELFKPRTSGPAPWIVFALPNIFERCCVQASDMCDLDSEVAIALELMVLLAQPQPNWALLLKVLCMRKFKVISTILTAASNFFHEDIQRKPISSEDCGGFLCCADGSCKTSTLSTPVMQTNNYYDIVLSSVEVALYVGNEDEFESVLIPVIIKKENWAKCFERKNVWNLIRPPWFEAMTNFVEPLLQATSNAVIGAVETGASMYQAMALTLACFNLLWDSVHPALPKMTTLLQEFVPYDVTPLHRSCLLQTIINSLYGRLLSDSQVLTRKGVGFSEEGKGKLSHKVSATSFDGTRRDKDEIALAVAEALCSIDEDNKHTDQIDEFLEQIKKNGRTIEPSDRVESTVQMTEMLASDILMSRNGKHNLKRLYHFIKCNREWIYQQLGVSEEAVKVEPNRGSPYCLSLTHTMFHIGYRKFDQLLTGELQPRWLKMLQTHLGLKPDKVWSQLSLRWEFRNVNSPSLSPHEIHIIGNISTMLKQCIG